MGVRKSTSRPRVLYTTGATGHTSTARSGSGSAGALRRLSLSTLYASKSARGMRKTGVARRACA